MLVTMRFGCDQVKSDGLEQKCTYSQTIPGVGMGWSLGMWTEFSARIPRTVTVRQ